MRLGINLNFGEISVTGGLGPRLFSTNAAGGALMWLTEELFLHRPERSLLPILRFQLPTLLARFSFPFLLLLHRNSTHGSARREPRSKSRLFKAFAFLIHFDIGKCAKRAKGKLQNPRKPRLSAAFQNYGHVCLQQRFYSPPLQGGVAATSIKWQPP